MLITESQIAQVASELKGRRGGVDNDYFGLLFLEKEFHLPREDACEQIAYGGNDFGVDGFHIDRQARTCTCFSSSSLSPLTNSSGPCNGLSVPALVESLIREASRLKTLCCATSRPG